MNIVPHGEWSKRGTWGSVNAAPKPGTLRAWVVHHQAGSVGNRDGLAQARHIESIHFNKRRKDGSHTWGMVAYSYIIATDGTVFEGRGLRHGNGANYSKTGPYGNGNTLSVCFAGDWHTSGPSQHGGILEPVEGSILRRMHTAFSTLVRELGDHLPLDPPLLGHRDVSATSCPGEYLYNLVLGGLFDSLPPEPPPQSDQPDFVTRGEVAMMITAALAENER